MKNVVCLLLLCCSTSTVRSEERALAAHWNALAIADAKGYRAIWSMVDFGEEAVGYLQKRLRASEVDSKLFAKLIAQLNDDDFGARESATARLVTLGRLAEPAVRKALANSPSAEVRRRCRNVLNALGVESKATSPEMLRGLRAIHILEQIGNASAVQLLQRLATGTNGGRLTEEAKSALRRLRE